MTEENPIIVVWWEPRWSYAPRELREFRRSLQLWSCLRIIAISIVVAALIAFITNSLIPGFQFNWAAALTASIGAIVVVLLVFMLLLATIPPLIFVTQKGFGWWWPPLLHEGFSYYKRSVIQSVTLTVRDDGMHYLRIRIKRRCKRIGLARRVNLVSLLTMFGDSLVVRDRRRHAKQTGTPP